MKEKRYFNVRLEFDKRKLEQTIENAMSVRLRVII